MTRPQPGMLGHVAGFALACAIGAGLAIAAPAPSEAMMDATQGERLWICHGPGHEVAEPSTGYHDWIIHQPAPGGEPKPGQFTYCERRNGQLILVAAKGACRGHGAVDFHSQTDEC